MSELDTLLLTSPDTNLWSSTNQHLSAPVAVLACKLLMPDFVEDGGLVFLSANYNADALNQWRKQDNISPEALQRIVNHVHLYDVFSGDPSPIELEHLRFVLRNMQATWQICLEATFPQRSFLVECFDEPYEYGPTIVFYETEKEVM